MGQMSAEEGGALARVAFVFCKLSRLSLTLLSLDGNESTKTKEIDTLDQQKKG